MPKKIVKRCVRPQCMQIYDETEKNRFCMCGAVLQVVEIDVKPKKNTYKKSLSPSKPKDNSTYPKSEDTYKPVSEEDLLVPEEESEILENQSEQVEPEDYEDDIVQDEDEDMFPKTKAFLYLLLEDKDKEVEFELSNITRIGRSADGVQVDIDLTEYAGKDVSREHAVIRKEKGGYYITNVSRNHSVRIMDPDDNVIALEYGKKVLLKSQDGIILSKKVLLQFEEEE